jgi:uncharacterized protein YbjT (DUF2867 family)
VSQEIMSKKTFTVVGATGNIGHVLSETLLSRGHQVRAIGRDAKKLGALSSKGAKTVNAAVDDAKALAEAFRGADGAFLMIPPSYTAPDMSVWQDRVGEAIVTAVRESGLRRAVSLSSVGGHQPMGTGPIAFLHRQEKRLGWIAGLDVLHLRPGFFMQNFLHGVAMMKQGFYASAIRADLPIEMVHTDDIGRKAAELLEDGSWSGKVVHEFSGPRALTLRDAVAAIGRDLKVVTPSYDEEVAAMKQHGMQDGTARLMSEMSRGFNEGKVAVTQLLAADHRGPTAFEKYAPELAKLARG